MSSSLMHTPSATSAATANRFSPTLVFVGLCVISLLLWWQPFFLTLRLALTDERYTHILLVLPLAGFLVRQQRDAISLGRSATTLGITLLALALILNFVGLLNPFGLDVETATAISMIGIVLWWIASYAVSFGWRSSRAQLFPLGFLLWMVPLPESIVDYLIRWLQQSSALAAQVCFQSVGTSISRTGTLLFLPGLTLEVAPECSSIRSSLLLVVLTMVLAQMTLRSSWRKALLIALSIPLAVAKNGIRIFTLGMLALHANRSYLTGRLHHQGGVIFFALALAAIFALLCLLRRGEPLVSRFVSSPRHKSLCC